MCAATDGSIYVVFHCGQKNSLRLVLYIQRWSGWLAITVWCDTEGVPGELAVHGFEQPHLWVPLGPFIFFGQLCTRPSWRLCSVRLV